MLKPANSSKNLLISVGVAKENKVVGGGGFSKTNKNLSKSQKPKISTVLPNVGANAKAI